MGIVCSDDLSKIALIGNPPRPLMVKIPRGRAPAGMLFKAWHAATGTDILKWTYLGRFKTPEALIKVFFARGTRPMAGEHCEQIKWYPASDFIPDNPKIQDPVLWWLVQAVRTRFKLGKDLWNQNVGVFEMG